MHIITTSSWERCVPGDQAHERGNHVLGGGPACGHEQSVRKEGRRAEVAGRRES
jgi:hypothetical protein